MKNLISISLLSIFLLAPSFTRSVNGEGKNNQKADKILAGCEKNEVLYQSVYYPITHRTNSNSLLQDQCSQKINGNPDLEKAIDWLKDEAYRIIRASKRLMNDSTAAFPPQVGIGYEAFWLRDYEYTLEGMADAYTGRELKEACLLFANNIGTDGAGVDCIKFDGTAIYKPGYGTMGDNPVADGSQFTVGVGWHTYRQTGDRQLLEKIIDPLIKTMNAVPINAKTFLVYINPDVAWDRCPYGFTDTVRKKGDVLFCSLLYVQASRQLGLMLEELGRREEAAHWNNIADKMAKSIRKVFWDNQTGLFRAATVQCTEPDIWGSAFAVYLDVATEKQSHAIARYFRMHYDEIVQHGQIRHLPGGIYWEKAGDKDAYQNGAYWATPTGWFVYTLDLVDPDMADKTIIDMVNHFREYGACEWIINSTVRLPNYLASAALPLAGIDKMQRRRRGMDKGKE